LFIFVSGCRSRPIVIHHSYNTNYAFGEMNTALKGQSFIKVNDYYLNRTHANPFKYTYTPSDNFTYSARIDDAYIDKKLNITAGKNKPLNVYDSRTLNIEGTEYEALYISGYNYALLIDKNGIINKDILYWRSVARPTYSEIKPSNVVIEKHDLELNSGRVPCDRVYFYSNIVCGTINYDMAYEGISNGTINIRYREYSRDNAEKPINTRVYSFETNSKRIQVKDLSIDILEATDDSIKFKVIDDSLKSREFMEWDYDPAFERIKSIR
jgi:hypothetical protein